MKSTKLVMLSAAALLAAGMSVATAETSMVPGKTGATAKPQGQCWDAASNSVKDKTGAPSGAKTPGAVTTGSSPSGQNNNAKGTGNSGTVATNSSNLPKC